MPTRPVLGHAIETYLLHTVTHPLPPVPNAFALCSILGLLWLILLPAPVHFTLPLPIRLHVCLCVSCSVGRIRGGARGNDERDQTLNQMLSEMDGFDNESQVGGWVGGWVGGVSSPPEGAAVVASGGWL